MFRTRRLTSQKRFQKRLRSSNCTLTKRSIRKYTRCCQNISPSERNELEKNTPTTHLIDWFLDLARSSLHLTVLDQRFESLNNLKLIRYSSPASSTPPILNRPHQLCSRWKRTERSASVSTTVGLTCLLWKTLTRSRAWTSAWTR